MAWMEPKTNWKSTDYFNAEDYNRIIGNLAYLKENSCVSDKKMDFVDMGAEKTYMDFIYAREINAIEDNLVTFNLRTYALNIGEKIVYTDNGNTPSYLEFNRIENAMLKLYNELQTHKANLPRLEFTLGRQKGIRV